MFGKVKGYFLVSEKEEDGVWKKRAKTLRKGGMRTLFFQKVLLCGKFKIHG